MNNLILVIEGKETEFVTLPYSREKFSTFKKEEQTLIKSGRRFLHEYPRVGNGNYVRDKFEKLNQVKEQ